MANGQTTDILAGQAVNSAMQGKDAVGSALGNAAMNATPTGAYIQAGAAALQALSSMSQNAPTASSNVSTPNFNNAPTAIVNFGSGGVNSSANPTNTQRPSTETAASSSDNGFSGLFKYMIFGIVGLIAVKSLRKA